LILVAGGIFMHKIEPVHHLLQNLLRWLEIHAGLVGGNHSIVVVKDLKIFGRKTMLLKMDTAINGWFAKH
jgi:hypothetical protein